MDFTGTFDYNMANLAINSEPNIVIFLAVTILFIVVTIISRYLFLGVAGFYMVYLENKNLNNRKKLLNDLILMKDIQTELEKEIEQATLKAAFQN